MVETAKKYMNNTERRSRKEDWYDEECKKTLISGNIAKIGKDQKPTKEAIKDYEEKRKTAKQICRRKKREYLKKKNGYNRKTLPKQRDTKPLPRSQEEKTDHEHENCRSKEGQLIGDTVEKLDRWAEYLETY
ncbi:hypothetical protein Zmor_002203 [Zophobas morio]|uniref:Uncharacterized protein n=1 Tax=Zophobas morio TaxID=2755281 RepID=A0AA38MTE9_9CUCU|nr:hypothetical protein Zmor_002203 [Zophobas morio]